jgi:hypothetical protein
MANFEPRADPADGASHAAIEVDHGVIEQADAATGDCKAEHKECSIVGKKTVFMMHQSGWDTQLRFSFSHAHRSDSH